MSDLPIKKKRGRKPLPPEQRKPKVKKPQKAPIRIDPMKRPDIVTNRPESLWKPGQSGNPTGRPKGSKNQGKSKKAIAQEAIIELFDLDKTGADSFTQQYL